MTVDFVIQCFACLHQKVFASNNFSQNGSATHDLVKQFINQGIQWFCQKRLGNQSPSQNGLATKGLVTSHKAIWQPAHIFEHQTYGNTWKIMELSASIPSQSRVDKSARFYQ